MLDETASGIEFEVEKTPIVVHEKIPCWVIGASLGGPAAVKRFMQSLPSDIKASFIIAQHIDENFLPVLAEILTNSSDFEVTVANGSNEMSRGKFYIAPLKGKTVFLKDGSMLVDHSQKWSGPYSPCIDDVIESVSHAYGESAGAIIFSGMGQDGVNGARRLREKGGQVWAQSLDTCANPTMPSAIIDSGEVDFIGTPEDLAQNLVTYLSAHA
nr:chemotaxis protein CheB [Aliikangiella sp. G2MR2-5]